jgi:hypothetical protein
MPSLEVQAEQLAARYVPPHTGRPCFLGDPDTLRELLKQIGLGNRREVACAIAGISQSTLQLWLARGRDPDADPDSPEVAFSALLKRAEALAEARVVGNVLRASEKEQFWAAGMTYLERKHPEAWGKRSEDGNSPKVVVQIGVQATDVSVTFASSASLSPASRNDLPELSTGQVEMLSPITAIMVPSIAGAADGHPAKPGHSLTGPVPERAGLAVDGGGERKAMRRRGPGKKKGHG